MTRFRTSIFTLLAIGLLLTPAFAQDAQTAPAATTQTTPILIDDVAVFDGEELLAATDVLIENGTITAIGDDLVAPDGASVIDGAGKTLLPGFIDAHVHTFTPDMLRQGLIFGVTTVYDMFTDENFAAAMRAEQESGAATYRADLLSAGTLATAPGGHGTQFGLTIDTLTNPDQAAGWVADRVAAGADYIKVVIEDFTEMGQAAQPTLDAEIVNAVIAATHDQGLLAVTHVQTLEAAEIAVAAGTDGLAHMFSDAVPTQDLIDQMVAQGTFVIPTFSVFQSIGPDEEVDQSLAGDSYIAPYLTPADLQSLAAPYEVEEGLSLSNALEGVRLFHEAGIPILAGTDAPNPGTAYGASIHRELELLMQAGFSASEALAAATSVNADVFGLDDRGRIAPNLLADLVLVNGDPTADIFATRDIEAIWKRGVRVDRESYAATLAGSRDAAAAQGELIAAGENALVSDFEAGDLSVAFGTEWVPTTDVQAGGDSTANIEVTAGGAQDSAHSLLVTGEVGTAFAAPWAGTMFMPGAQPFGPTDLSSKPTLHFWARGENGPYRIQLFCQNLGQIPAETTFETGAEWQEFDIALGDVGGCDVSGVMAVIFSAGQPGEFAFQIDDVEFR